MAGKVIVLALRTALAWTFLHAGLLKVWDFTQARFATPDFAVAIQQFHLSPWPDLTLVLAIFLPWVEIVAALGLFFRRVQLGASGTILSLTILFMAALGSAAARGLRIECGCFGRDQASTDIPALLLRDACILAGALFLLIRDSRAALAGRGEMFADQMRFTLPAEK